MFSLSGPLWFLPAGLRLAALWMSNRGDWWLIGVADVATIFALTWYRDGLSAPAMHVAAAAAAWGTYLAVLSRFARAPGIGPTPESMMRFLLCGLGASLSNAAAMIALQAIDAGASQAPLMPFFQWALRDFIGILLVAPIIRMAIAQVRGHGEPLRATLAHGLVFAPALVAAGLSLVPIERIELYPVAIASFLLLWIAYRFGWRAGAVTLLLLCASVWLVDERLARTWLPVQLQMLLAAAGFATLSLGISADALRTQGRALRASIEMLSMRTRALADTASRLVSQQEAERRRIGAELHDQLGQDMTAIATRLRLLSRMADSPQLLDGLRAIDTLVLAAHDHLRETIQSLHPLVLDRFGLARALSEGPMVELAREHDIDYRCDIEGDVDALPPEIAISLYRVCQEATTNAVRHGCGGRLRIALQVHRHFVASDVTLRIEDAAGRFDIAVDHPGLGLQSIHDRADAMGAQYRFDPESGTPRHQLDVRVKRSAPLTET